MRSFRFLNKLSLFTLILAIVTGWLFSGWPSIFNFPPALPVARAAMPAFVACGAGSASTSAITPALPLGIAANDILLLFLETTSQTIAVANGNGGTWTQVTNSPQTAGSTTRLTVFWSRYNGAQGNPTTSDSGDHQIGAICAYRGIITTGDPWYATSGGTDTTSDTSGSIPGATTTGPDSLVVIVGTADDNADTPITAVSNADLANISAARVNAESNQGDNGGLTVFDGEKASAGAYGTTSLTYTSATTKAMMTVALKPPPTTVIGDGVDPGNTTIAPGGSITDLDSFTLNTTTGTDTVTAITVSLSAGSSGGISLVSITSNGGLTTYCSQAPLSDTVSVSSCSIPVTTTSTQFKVRITPKAHADMSAPPGSTYSVTGTVTAFTSTNAQSGTDIDSATVTIDNQSPANVTSASGTVGNQQVGLSWTNPADADFNSTVVLRSSSGAVSDTPVEGSTYIVGDTIGVSTVACVETFSSSSCSNTGLTNGTAYHYKIFSKDNYSNYATGAVPTGSPFTPTPPADTTAPSAVLNLSASNATQTSIDLSWTAPGDDGSTGTATTYDVRYSTSVINDLNFSSAIQATGEPAPQIAGTSQSMTVSSLSSGTTYYFAMKTSDEALNTSGISNVVSLATLTAPDITAPAAVTNLAASNPTANTINLSWTAPGDDGSTGTATTYDVRYSTSVINDANFSSATAVIGEPTPSVAGTSESMTISGLSSGTVYYFALKTSDEVPNTSAISNIVTETTATPPDTTAPAAVTNLAISNPTENTIDLSWTAPGDDGSIGTATSYDVRYSTSVITAGNFGSATQVTNEPMPSAAGASQSMTIFSLSPSTTYYFALKTSDEVPNTSAISNVPTGTTATPADATAPSAISDLATSNVSNNSVDLSWTAPGDDGNTGTATSYDIRYSTSAITAGNFSSATQASNPPSPEIVGTSQSMTISGLSATTLYYFAMKTSDEVPNTSSISNVTSTTTIATPDTTAPAAVFDLSASGAATNSLNLSWTAPGDDGSTGTATTYDIRYSTSAITSSNFSSATQVSGEPTPSIAGTSESMTISGLSAGTTYHFALKTLDEVPNTSAISNVPSLATASVSVPAPPSGGTGGVVLRKATFAGQVYPKSKVDITYKPLDASFIQSIQITNTVNDAGVFDASYIGLASGKYLFTLKAIDKDDRATSILPFNITLDGTLFEIKDILFPPTIGFSKSIIAKNDILKVTGYAAPNYVVKLEVDGAEFKSSKADLSGLWSFDVDATYLSYGDHSAKAAQVSSDGKQKNFSLTRTFKIANLPVSKADMNGDGKVGISDWSIFLFQWGSTNESVRIKNDLNGDGKINIFDLSIFLQIIKI